jgi:hypothetical protein
MRSRDRYEVRVPFEYEIERDQKQKGLLNNIGAGGMCFSSLHYLSEGRSLNVKIPMLGLDLVAEGTVVWCKRNTARYKIGVKFMNELPPKHLESMLV